MAKVTAAKGSIRPLSRVGDADLVERRRAQIVEAATRLVARQGFAKTVVRDIAEEANISVGLVYEYVRSKEDILFLIYEHWARVWGDGLEKALARGKDPLDQLMSGVAFLVSVADKHSDVTHLFYRETGHLSDYGTEQAKQTEREMVDRLTAVLDAAVEADLLRAETDRVALATELILLCHGWVLKGYLLRKGRTPAGYATSLVEMTVNGWATPAGRKAWERRRG
ncbi:MAG: TetR/AcrR family transcriptional regulator [Actinomycetota bacterium]|jgi:TetR/AcrR family transcriptional regulator, cholesterol catabolism regulator